MVYLESPAGVGYNAFSGSFSYDDENVSHENLKALQLFFEAFPELKTRDLYLAGESYAGIYIPYLALRIDEFNQKSSEKINLKGFMIGNGVTNWKYDVTPAFVKMSYSHGLISNSLHQKLEKLNCDFADVGSKPLSPECNEAFIAFRESVAQVYPYDIYRPPEDIYQAKTSVMSIEKMLKLETDANSKSMSYINFSKVFGDRQSNDFAVVDRFMNTDDVKNALNVPLSHGWKECTPIDYTKLEKATQWIYPLLKGKYRMMHYSGDTDGVVPTIGTIGWMEDLGWKVTKKYSPWMAEKLIIGGYTESREDLDLITIHGCGHMAPQWKRQPSFVAISSWLQNKDLPRP